jgi:hypothetical protein
MRSSGIIPTEILNQILLWFSSTLQQIYLCTLGTSKISSFLNIQKIFKTSKPFPYAPA